MFKVIRNEQTVAICTELTEAEALMLTLNGDHIGEDEYRLVGMDETDVSSMLYALAKWMPGALRKI